MTKLIAEIGINHNGSYQEAKKLINMASLANCWGVKFQYRNLNNYFSNLSKSSELGKEIIDEEIKKNHLNHKQILKLATYAKKNIKVGLSLFTKKDYKSFENYKFDFFKIPSPVCHDYDLINFLKKKSNLLIISFGKNRQWKLWNQASLILSLFIGPRAKFASSHKASGRLGCGNHVLWGANLYWTLLFRVA